MLAKSGINEKELLMGRPYGGVQFYYKKTLGYNSIFVEAENARICSILYKYDKTVILVTCVYMPSDINSNIYEYNEILGDIHMLQSLYTPHYMIGIPRDIGQQHTYSYFSRFIYIINWTIVI